MHNLGVLVRFVMEKLFNCGGMGSYMKYLNHSTINRRSPVRFQPKDEFSTFTLLTTTGKTKIAFYAIISLI